MGLHKLWNRAKQWGASGWKRAKHIGTQGLNKAAALYNKFDNASGGNAANMIGQGVGALASLSPWSKAAAQIAGAGMDAIGGMMSDGNKWKQRLQNFGKGLSFEHGNNETKPTIPSVKKRPIGNNSGGNSMMRNGVNRLM